MTAPDLTVVATAHNETIVAGPTMRSAEKAIAAAETAGFSVERLLAFDAPSDLCRAFFADFSHWRKIEFDFRDQGKTRNAAIAEAKGRWMAILDGDDLVSENWFDAACTILKEASTENHRIIVHPELNWIFDAGAFVFAKPAQAEQLFSGYTMSQSNYYDAMCVAPREVWAHHPYPDRAVRDGFAYEDWQWAIETTSGGWEHVVAPDTIIFKRRRDSSQTHESRANQVLIRALEATAIDKVRTLGRLSARVKAKGE